MRLIRCNKPFRMLSQFTSDGGKACLSDIVTVPGVYPAGRLDHDSEGLLLLCDDGRTISRIADPRHKLPKTYLAQVEGLIDAAALQRLQTGLLLKDGPTRPAVARSVSEPAWLWPREPPVRFRRHIPTSWLELTITEGRNRQVRRMAAAIGCPVLRLIRTRIGPWGLDGLVPGAWCDADPAMLPPAPDPPRRRAGRSGHRQRR